MLIFADLIVCNENIFGGITCGYSILVTAATDNRSLLISLNKK